MRLLYAREELVLISQEVVPRGAARRSGQPYYVRGRAADGQASPAASSRRSFGGAAFGCAVLRRLGRVLLRAGGVDKGCDGSAGAGSRRRYAAVLVAVCRHGVPPLLASKGAFAASENSKNG